MSDGGNADPNATVQHPAWNGALGERWLLHRQRLDLLLAPFGRASVAALGDIAGARVLDVGCGIGTTTVAVSRAVGPDGSVVGADISALLISEAADAHAGGGVRFIVADAAHDDLGGMYDAAHSRFGSMFFTDPMVAFAHVRSHLRPGGRLAMVVWQAPAENEWVWLPLEVAGEHVAVPEPPPPGSPGPFSLADPELTEKILAVAGYDEIVIEDCRRVIGIDADAATTAEFLLGMLPTGPVLDELGPDRSAEIAALVARELPTTSEGPEGAVELPAAAWLVTASA